MEKNNCGEFVATLCMVMSNCSGLAFLWGDVLLFGCMVNYGNRIRWTVVCKRFGTYLLVKKFGTSSISPLV